MNQIALSNDLRVITAEINSYKQVAGQAIFEIGRRLKHVKENDLVHGEFGNWLEQIDMNKSQASRFIKIFDELGDSNLLTSANMGFRNLLEIATMPDDQRDKSHTIPSTGEIKAVDEMTVRELREVKKALQEAEKDKEHLAALLTEERNKPQRVVEKLVLPDHVKKKMEDDEFNLQNLRKGYQELKEKLQHLQLSDPVDFDEKQAELQRKKLQHEADINTIQLRIQIKNFLEKASIGTFIQGAIATSDHVEKQKLQESVDMLEQFINILKLALKGRRIGEINE